MCRWVSYWIKVGYRATVGSGAFTVFGQSGGTFEVAAPALTVTLPSITGLYAQNSSLPVTWTTSVPVGAGEFAVWVQNGTTWDMYIGQVVPNNGTASYATSVTLRRAVGHHLRHRRWVSAHGGDRSLHCLWL